MTDEPQEPEFLSERHRALVKRVQDWLDKFAEEKINVNYGASLTAVVAMAQKIYIDTLVDTGVIEREAAVCAELEIQALILENQFNKALIQRDEDILRAAQEAGRPKLVQGPRLIIPGGGQRALRNLNRN